MQGVIIHEDNIKKRAGLPLDSDSPVGDFLSTDSVKNLPLFPEEALLCLLVEELELVKIKSHCSLHTNIEVNV